MCNAKLYDDAKIAIQKMSDDASVDQETTLNNLQGLVDEISELIEALVGEM